MHTIARDTADTMTKLRSRLREYEKSNETKLICPLSRYHCRYCLKPVFGSCKKLEDYLETGEWK